MNNITSRVTIIRKIVGMHSLGLQLLYSGRKILVAAVLIVLLKCRSVKNQRCLYKFVWLLYSYFP